MRPVAIRATKPRPRYLRVVVDNKAAHRPSEPLRGVATVSIAIVLLVALAVFVGVR